MTRETRPDVRGLLEMLTYRRPHGGETERDYVARFVAPTGAKPDAFGNMVLRVGDAPVLWSCHTDSAHKPGEEGKQRITTGDGIVTLRQGEQATCLGADDATGLWLMLEMIRGDVPGTYVFHRGEEVGGLGSRHIARDEPATLDGIRYAVAFDRRGTGSVITHQAYGRCCSDAFAGALAEALGDGWRPDDTGTFTDTANYVDLVPECTNLSVGYFDEHTPHETLDIAHLLTLRDAMLSIDVSSLPCERDPTVSEEWDDPSEWWEPLGRDDERRGDGRGTLEDLVYAYPEIATQVLEEMGCTKADFRHEIRRWYGDDGKVHGC